MLALLFSIGDDRYAVDVARLQEIAPLVALKKIPMAPEYVAGLLDFRGEPVPVIDMSCFASGKPSRRVFGTRILVVKYRRNNDTTPRLLGLIVERVERTQRFEADAFQDTGVDVEGAKFLGQVVKTDEGVVQLVHPNDLLPAEVHNMLFQGA